MLQHMQPRWRILLATIGPGLVVMLADTEVGSVITASQSGAQWGYRLLLPQFLLIPLMYMVQELATRLALSTGKGFAELIAQKMGKPLAWLAISMLAISCFGALVTEMGGLAAVGTLFGIPAWQSITGLIGGILLMVGLGAYQTVERAVIALGLFEIGFFFVAWRADPQPAMVLSQMLQIPISSKPYLYLLAANIGTTIMPWAIFYQQSALLDKGLDNSHLKLARWDILIGAVFCQLVTAAILIAAAASLGGHSQPVALDSIGQIVDAFRAALGNTFGRIVFAIGLVGGALVATIVVCLTAAWAFGEVAGTHHSLEHDPLEAPWFYAAFAAILIASGLVVASGTNLVKLAIAMGVLNAILLPLALFFLYRLATTCLDGELRLSRPYALLMAASFLLAAFTSLFSALTGISA